VGEKTGWREGLKKTIGALPSLFLVVLVIGGIIAGIFTATEAGAAAVLYALLLSVVFYREVKLRDIPGILLKSAETTAIVMLLIATSTGMSWILSYTNIPRNISASLIALSDNPFFILLIINAVLLTIGTFMDMTPAVLIFTPVFLPVAVNLGITPLHFGIVMVLNLCIGLCTPPVGSVLFVGCSIGRTSIQRMTRALWPFYIAMLISLLLVTAFPDISLALPRLLGY
jgi:tripartite ATP-independent transporter DctM subunit